MPKVVQHDRLHLQLAALTCPCEDLDEAIDRLVLNSDGPSADMVLDAARTAKQVLAMVRAVQREHFSAAA
jgi:hypothetical protein